MPRSVTQMAAYEATVYIKSYEVAVVVVHMPVYGPVNFQQEFYSLNFIFTVR